MVYQFNQDRLMPMEGLDLRNCQAVVLPAEQANALRVFGFSDRTLRECEHIRYTQSEAFDSYTFGTLKIPAKEQKSGQFWHVAFYLTTEQMFLVGKTERECRWLEQMIEQEQERITSFPQLVEVFFESLLRKDYGFLESLESQINQIEEKVLKGHLDQFNPQMLRIRKHLLQCHNFYTRLSMVADNLVENENDLLPEEVLRIFRHYASYLQKLTSTAQMLREYSVQVQEIYQAEVDIHQNKIMKMLTVVTTIFLPLTLIAGWYGMNFISMPELKWPYGYAMVIGLSAAVAGISIWIFKKNKYL